MNKLHRGDQFAGMPREAPDDFFGELWARELLKDAAPALLAACKAALENLWILCPDEPAASIQWKETVDLLVGTIREAEHGKADV